MYVFIKRKTAHFIKFPLITSEVDARLKYPPYQVPTNSNRLGTKNLSKFAESRLEIREKSAVSEDYHRRGFALVRKCKQMKINLIIDYSFIHHISLVRVVIYAAVDPDIGVLLEK